MRLQITWMENGEVLVFEYEQEEAEVERLRSENNRINKLREAEINQAGAAERVYLEAMMVKDARIKELEATCDKMTGALRDAGRRQDRLEAAFLKARQCPTCKGEGTIHPIGQPIDSICPKCLGDPESMAREALERIKEGRKDD